MKRLLVIIGAIVVVAGLAVGLVLFKPWLGQRLRPAWARRRRRAA